MCLPRRSGLRRELRRKGASVVMARIKPGRARCPGNLSGMQSVATTQIQATGHPSCTALTGRGCKHTRSAATGPRGSSGWVCGRTMGATAHFAARLGELQPHAQFCVTPAAHAQSRSAAREMSVAAPRELIPAPTQALKFCLRLLTLQYACRCPKLRLHEGGRPWLTPRNLGGFLGCKLHRVQLCFLSTSLSPAKGTPSSMRTAAVSVQLVWGQQLSGPSSLCKLVSRLFAHFSYSLHRCPPGTGQSRHSTLKTSPRETSPSHSSPSSQQDPLPRAARLHLQREQHLEILPQHHFNPSGREAAQSSPWSCAAHTACVVTEWLTSVLQLARPLAEGTELGKDSSVAARPN